MRLTFTLTELVAIAITLLFTGALFGCFFLVGSPALSAAVYERLPGFYLVMGGSVLLFLSLCVSLSVLQRGPSVMDNPQRVVAGPQPDEEDEDLDEDELDDDEDFDDDEDDEDFDEDDDLDEEEELEDSLQRYRNPAIR